MLRCILRSALSVTALLSATACAVSDTRGSRTVRDSVGVEIVENTRPASELGPFVLDSVPVIDLGRDLDNPHEEFSGFLFPVRLSDGRVVVANSGSHELRVFDATGKWLKSVGRDGEGPGEFRNLGWLQIGVGDTLRTYDWNLLRISVFAPDGAFQRFMLLTAPGEMVGLRPLDVLDDGRIITRTQNAVTMNSKAGVHRDTVALLVHDASGRLTDTIGHYPGAEAWVARTAKSVSVSDRPFGKEFFAVAHQKRVFVGTADRPEILVANPAGTVSRIVRWGLATQPVTTADIDAYIQRAGEGWEPGSESRRVRYLESLRSAPYPEVKPAYAGVLVSPDGSLWIRRYADAARPDDVTFDVIDSTGAWLGATQMPARFTPTQISSAHVVGTWRAEDDVQHVRVYRLTRRK